MDRIVLRTHFIKLDLGITQRHPHPLYHFDQHLKRLLNLLEVTNDLPIYVIKNLSQVLMEEEL